MQFQKPLGARDFYPEDTSPRENVLSILKSTCKRYGFSEVDCPDIENLSLLVAKSGEEIKTQIFNLEKKGDEELALRPEFTPTFARMFIERQKVLQKPVKWFTFGRCWRYERPQKGRLREFFQLNAEIYGSDTALADAEVISLAIECLVSLGLTKKDFKVKINSRELLESLLEGMGIKNSVDVFRVIDKKRKISSEAFVEELGKAGLDNDKISRLLTFLNLNDLNEFSSPLIKVATARNKLAQVFSYLEKLGKKDFIEFDLSVARGLAYYTGTVFECFDRDEKLRAVFAGGRYDKMIEQLGGQPCPAVGFAMGDVTLQLLLEQKKLWPKADVGIEYFVAPMSEKQVPFALKVLSKVREKYTSDIDLMGRKLDKQLKFASSIGAAKVLIVGDDEVRTGKITVKDLQTGKQEKTSMDKI